MRGFAAVIQGSRLRSASLQVAYWKFRAHPAIDCLKGLGRQRGLGSARTARLTGVRPKRSKIRQKYRNIRRGSSSSRWACTSMCTRSNSFSPSCLCTSTSLSTRMGPDSESRTISCNSVSRKRSGADQLIRSASAGNAMARQGWRNVSSVAFQAASYSVVGFNTRVLRRGAWKVTGRASASSRRTAFWPGLRGTTTGLWRLSANQSAVVVLRKRGQTADQKTGGSLRPTERSRRCGVVPFVRDDASRSRFGAG